MKNSSKDVFQMIEGTIGMVYSSKNIKDLETKSIHVKRRLDAMSNYFLYISNDFNTGIFYDNRDLIDKYQILTNIYLKDIEHYLALELSEILNEINGLHEKMSNSLIKLKDNGIFFIDENKQDILIDGVIRLHQETPKHLNIILNR